MQLKMKKVGTVVRSILDNEDKFINMSDEELKAFMNKQRELIGISPNKKPALDMILEDVFGCVKEASKRVLGLDAYRVQLEGAYHLHKGSIIEMKTGEGKTFTCTFPAILNALIGNVHIITVNDYLAKRDAKDMSRLYNFLGFTCGCITTTMTDEEKRNAYSCDIVYITNTEIGFDYLRDNQKFNSADKILPPLDYAIIDEADSILIDEARTPLIISGEKSIDSSIYTIIDMFIKSLKRGRDKKVLIEGDELFKKQSENKLNESEVDELGDFTVDELNKKIILTQRGLSKVQSFFKVKLKDDASFIYYIENSLKANYLFKRDKDYLVRDNAIFLIDANTGRVMDGRQYSHGLHQAIQAKERVEVSKENITLATITLQSFFKMYDKLSGMTGTIETDKKEIEKIYGVKVRKIDTNKPVIRKDHSDKIFITKEEKYNYLYELIKSHDEQPLLIGTSSVKESEAVSQFLSDKNIKHNVLNAKNHEKEAHIISQAGKLGSITVATNMAGRGTDILLGGNPSDQALLDLKKEGYDDEHLFNAQSAIVDEEYQEVKNKYEEYKSKYKEIAKLDKEEVIKKGGLFVIGMEKQDSKRVDNQLRGRSGRQGDVGESIFLASIEDDNIKNLLKDSSKKKIIKNKNDNSYATRIIRRVQKQIEDMNFEQRKNIFKYDLVNDKYRADFYIYRDKVLESDLSDLMTLIRENIKHDDIEHVLDSYLESKREQGYDPAEYLRYSFLNILDDNYIDFIVAIDLLKDFTGLVNYGNKKPIDIYRQSTKEYYNKLITASYIVLYQELKKSMKTNITISI